MTVAFIELFREVRELHRLKTLGTFNTSGTFGAEVSHNKTSIFTNDGFAYQYQ